MYKLWTIKDTLNSCLIYFHNCRIIRERVLERVAETEDKFCIKTTLMNIMEEIKNIKTSLNMVDNKKKDGDLNFHE